MMDMTDNSNSAMNVVLIKPANVIGHDGLTQNILLLHELSNKIDQYFAMQTMG